MSELREHLKKLSRQVSNRLQKKNLRGKTVQIKLRWSNFTTLTRQTTLPQAINDFDTIYHVGGKLLEQAWKEGRRVRLIGIGVHNLDTQAHQLGLWDTTAQKDIKLQETLQELKNKYGENIISRGL